jgi:Sulfatase-modifying factor enzyme 1
MLRLARIGLALAPALLVAATASADSTSAKKPPKKPGTTTPAPAAPAKPAAPAHKKPHAPALPGGPTPKKPHARPHAPATHKHAGAPGPRPRPNIALLVKAERVTIPATLPAVVPGGECPEDMVNIDDRLCVDRYEGSLVEVTPDGDERPWSPYEMPLETKSYRAVSVANVFPQGYISGIEAQQACLLAGKRLCNPVEWKKACRGPDDTTFGYGAERQAGRCNDHGRSPMLDFYPQVNVSWRLVGMTEMNDPRLNALAGTLAKTGEHDGCTNDYGVYDMVGNLHEWTNDPAGTFQGGYYLDTSQNGDGCNYTTTAHEFTYHDYSTGFRCCADVTPPRAEEPKEP